MVNRMKNTATRKKPVMTTRKVAFVLPEPVAEELSARAKKLECSRGRIVAEALALFFQTKDVEAVAALFAQQAAMDPDFMADNEEVLRDFEALDNEADREAFQ